MARPKQISDEDLIACARKHFLDEGIHVSLQTIADHLGISQPALVKRCATKRNLLILALKPSLPMFLGDLMQAPSADDDLFTRLNALALQTIEYLSTAMPRVMRLRDAGIELNELFEGFPKAPPLMMREAFAGFFARAIEHKHLSTIHPVETATMFLGVLQGYVLVQILESADFDREKAQHYVYHTLETLRKGLC